MATNIRRTISRALTPETRIVLGTVKKIEEEEAYIEFNLPHSITVTDPKCFAFVLMEKLPPDVKVGTVLEFVVRVKF